jgi:glycosyltransferase involved in cell wall biosynthesis
MAFGEPTDITRNILAGMQDEKKAILILGALPPPLHGASLYYQNLVTSQRLQDFFKVHFLNLNLANVLDSYQKFSLNKVIRASVFLIKFVALLTSERIDFVFGAIAFPKYPFLKDSLFVILARLFRKKVVGCVLGTGLKENYRLSSRLMKKYYRLIGKYYTAFISPGKKMSRKDFYSIFPIEKLIGVPFGTIPVIKEKININPEIVFYNVLYMGNFIRSKGIFDTLKSIKHVIAKHQNVKFILAGEWISLKDEAEAIKIIKEDKISDYVEFVGIIMDQKKRDIMLKSHIFLLPTYYEFEGLPLALLDAMSCGQFIIATDHAAIGEVIKDGTNGFFCRKGDPQDLGEKILFAIEKKDLTCRIRNQNYSEFHNLYTHEKYVERLAQALNDICANEID